MLDQNMSYKYIVIIIGATLLNLFSEESFEIKIDKRSPNEILLEQIQKHEVNTEKIEYKAEFNGRNLADVTGKIKCVTIILHNNNAIDRQDKIIKSIKHEIINAKCHGDKPDISVAIQFDYSAIIELENGKTLQMQINIPGFVVMGLFFY